MWRDKYADLQSKHAEAMLELGVLRREPTQVVSVSEMTAMEKDNRLLKLTVSTLEERLKMLESVGDRINLKEQLEVALEQTRSLTSTVQSLTQQLDLSENQLEEMKRSYRAVEAIQKDVAARQAETQALIRAVTAAENAHRPCGRIIEGLTNRVAVAENADRVSSEAKSRLQTELVTVKAAAKKASDMAAALEIALKEATQQRLDLQDALRREGDHSRDQIAHIQTQVHETQSKVINERKRAQDAEAETAQVNAQLKALAVTLKSERRRIRQLQDEYDVLRSNLETITAAKKQAEAQAAAAQNEARTAQRQLIQQQALYETASADLSRALDTIREHLGVEKNRREEMDQLVGRLEKYGGTTQESEAVAIVRSHTLAKVLAFAVDPAGAMLDQQEDVPSDHQQHPSQHGAAGGGGGGGGGGAAATNQLQEYDASGKPGTGPAEIGELQQLVRGHNDSALRHRAQAALRQFLGAWKKPLSAQPSRAAMDISTAAAAVDLITNWSMRVQEVAQNSSAKAIARLLVRRSKRMVHSWIAEIGAIFEAAPTDGFVTVQETHADRPAHLAGLRKGDVIIAINDTPVSTPEAVRRAVQSCLPGDAAAVTIIQGSRTIMGQVPGVHENVSVFRKVQGRQLRVKIEAGQTCTVSLTMGAQVSSAPLHTRACLIICYRVMFSFFPFYLNVLPNS